jgi:hypothetical protein
MKSTFLRIITLVIIVISFSQFSIAQSVTGKGSNEVLTDMNKYLKAVNLDEGKISNKEYLNEFLKTAVEDNWNNNIQFWISAQWGTKNYNGYISKQFELKGNDLTSVGSESRPAKTSEGNYFGINFDGDNDYWVNSSFKAEQPFSILIVYKADNSKSENVLLESSGTKVDQIRVENDKDGKPQLVIESGGEVKLSGLTDGINYVYVEYNLNDSKVFINGKLAYNNIIGLSDFDGIQIAKGTVNYKYENFKGSIYEIGIIKNTLNDQARNDLFTLMKKTYNLK